MRDKNHGGLRIHCPRHVVAPCDAGSGEDGLDHFSVNVRQAEIATLEPKRKLLVIDAKAVQDRGIEIVHVHGIADHVVTEIVGLADLDSRLDAATGKPD